LFDQPDRFMASIFTIIRNGRLVDLPPD
jgi:hypothetical protein